MPSEQPTDEDEQVDIYDDDVQEGMMWAAVAEQVENGYFDERDDNAE